MAPRARQSVSGFYESMVSMLDAGLTRSAVKLAEMAFGLKEAGHECLTEAQLSHAYLFTGDYYSAKSEYQLAEHYYEKLIECGEGWSIGGLAETFFDGCSESESQMSVDPPSELSLADLKCKRAACLAELKRTEEALQLLNTVPVAERSAKIYMLMGNLHRLRGSELSALQCFRKVLAKADGAIDAAEHLAAMGVDIDEINSLLKPRGWANEWIKAYSSFLAGDAATAIKTIQDSPVFSETPQGLALMGKARYKLNDWFLAAEYFEKAHNKLPTMQFGMETLTKIYATKDRFEKMDDCEHIAVGMRNVAPHSAITLLCMAYFSTVSKRPNVTLALAEKAMKANPLNREAYLAVADLYLSVDVPKSAKILNDAIIVDRHCFEAYEALYNIYSRVGKAKDAAAVVNKAYDVFGSDARIFTLEAKRLRAQGSSDSKRKATIASEFARTYGRLLGTRITLPPEIKLAPEALKKTKKYLEKALRKNGRYVPAVSELAEVYNEMGLYDQAINLLTDVLGYIRIGKVHRHLGHCLFTYKQDKDAAFDAYTGALDLDPHDGAAISGMADMSSPEEMAASEDTRPEGFCRKPNQPYGGVSFITCAERMEDEPESVATTGEDDIDEEEVEDEEEQEEEEEEEEQEDGEIVEDEAGNPEDALVEHWMDVEADS